MPFIPNAAVIRVVHRMNRQNVPIYNVFHHTIPPGISPALMQAYAGILGLLYTNTILEQLSAGVNYEECVVYSMQSESAPTGSWSAPDPSPGGIDDEGNNRGAAAVITFRTANRGRSGRGRVYLGGVAEIGVVEGVLTGPYGASLEAVVENYRTGAAAEDLPLIVYSQFTANAPRVVGLAQPVVSVELRSNILGSQRRRNQRP